MAKTMYDIIKKQNGETFAKAIRNHDNGIFDIPDLDKIVKYAGRDAEPIMPYLVSLKGVKIEEHGVHQDPIELLKRAGYDAYVANTLEKQNAIKKYFAHGEELCTFRDSSRFKNYYIINAVRHDVDKIKRARFRSPQREDEYGTSVISIQILKSGGFISIKNRYNHTVVNPDNTFNSNPDNIIPGLSDALRHYFNVDFSAQQVELPRNYVVIKNQICKCQSEENNIYFGADFYAKDGRIYAIDKRHEMMLGNGLMLSLKDKRIIDMSSGDYDAFTMDASVREQFVASLNAAIDGKKIQVVKNPLGGHDIVADGKQILTVEDGELVNINIPDADAIMLKLFRNLRGELDFSGVKNLEMSNVDLSQVTAMKINPNADRVCWLGVSRTASDDANNGLMDLDFSGVKTLDLKNVRYGDTGVIKINPNADTIDFSAVHGIKFPEHLDLGNVKKVMMSSGVDLSGARDVKFNPNATEITLFGNLGLRLRGDHDFSNVRTLRIYGTDMLHVDNIKLNPGAKWIELNNTRLPLRGAVDLSNVGSLTMGDVDMSGVTSIQFPKHTGALVLTNIHGLKQDVLDFRGADSVFLTNIDLSGVSSVLFNENSDVVRLDSVRGLRGTYDVSGVNKLHALYTDLSNVDMRFNKSAQSIDLGHCRGLHGDLDFSDVDKLYLADVDLSRASSVRFNPNATNIDLRGAYGLRGDLDFSHVAGLAISGAFLSNVTSIKLNSAPNAYIDEDVATIQLRVGKNKLEYAMAQLAQKIKTKFQSQGAENE